MFRSPVTLENTEFTVNALSLILRTPKLNNKDNKSDCIEGAEMRP